MIRDDEPGDLVYRPSEEKFEAVVEDIASAGARPAGAGRHDLDREVSSGSRLLLKPKIKHEVLNAKHHEREAEIVAQAGRRAR
jgi:preprotein translocase subunit SecA